MKTPVPTERQVQRAILRMMGVAFRSCLVWHVPNGAFLGADEKARRRTMGGLLGDGLKPGAPDLAVYWNHGHALLEVKRPGCAGRLSDEQRKIHAELEEMGWSVAVVTSTEEAFRFLVNRGAPTSVREWREAA
jgi:hypothetical protein